MVAQCTTVAAGPDQALNPELEGGLLHHGLPAAVAMSSQPGLSGIWAQRTALACQASDSTLSRPAYTPQANRAIRNHFTESILEGHCPSNVSLLLGWGVIAHLAFVPGTEFFAGHVDQALHGVVLVG